MSEIREIQSRLADPFSPDEVSWKPQSVKGGRALAIAYVDARTVMDRLDSVLGLGGWQTHYRELPEGVVCRLRVRIGGEWTEHEDVGSFSEQPDGGDRLKAAFSDALKRVAVHVGVGRYLYALPHQWCDYDLIKKQFTQTPRLPAWALPKGQPAPAAKPAPMHDANRPGAVAARLVKELAECRTWQDKERLFEQITDAAGRKELAGADLEAVRAAARETNGRLPSPPKQPA